MAISRTFYTLRTAIPADIDLRTDLESSNCCFNKGYTPPPFKLEHEEDEDGNLTGRVMVNFELNPFTSTCNCLIECTSGALIFTEDEEAIGQFCPPDEDFQVILPSVYFTVTTPSTLIFNFEDASGNRTSIEVNSLVQVIPQIPLTILVEEGPRNHIQVGTPIFSHTQVDLRGAAVQDQVERYTEHESNRQIWVDWTIIPDTKPFHRGGKDLVHWDRDVRSGIEYGYRVRFRSTFDHASQWSAWSTRLITSASAPFYYLGFVQQFYVGEVVSITPEAEGYTYFEEVD